MELTTSWKEEGRQEGRRQIIMRQISRRWGSLSPRLEKKIRALSITQLEELAEALLDFSSPAEVENGLGQH